MINPSSYPNCIRHVRNLSVTCAMYLPRDPSHAPSLFHIYNVSVTWGTYLTRAHCTPYICDMHNPSATFTLYVTCAMYSSRVGLHCICHVYFISVRYTIHLLNSHCICIVCNLSLICKMYLSRIN